METSNSFNFKQKEIVQNFENLVKEVFLSNNENQKNEMLEKVESILKICKTSTVSNYENPRPAKRLKVELMDKVDSNLANFKKNLQGPQKNTIFVEDTKVDSSKLPNELWMKILTYLPTRDIFATFALVNKHFHRLTLDPRSIKYLQIRDIDSDCMDQLYNMKKVLKRCKNLKELSITKTTYDYNDAFVMEAMEITKNLESVKISVETFISSIERYREAINTFFEINHKTLKRIHLRLSPEHCECNFSFTSLSLCQKLEHLSGVFHEHDMEWMSQARLLKKLEWTMDGYELESVFDTKMDMPNLKCLSINGLYLKNEHSIDYDKLSEQHLPALEKLHLTTEDAHFENRPTLDLEQILKLVENFPKLDTLQIDGIEEESLPEVNVPNEDLYEMFKDFGILVIFGSVNHVSNNIQKKFEDFLEHDPVTLEKYNQAKLAYAKWCKNNRCFDIDFEDWF